MNVKYKSGCFTLQSINSSINQFINHAPVPLRLLFCPPSCPSLPPSPRSLLSNVLQFLQSMLGDVYDTQYTLYVHPEKLDQFKSDLSDMDSGLTLKLGSFCLVQDVHYSEALDLSSIWTNITGVVLPLTDPRGKITYCLKKTTVLHLYGNLKTVFTTYWHISCKNQSSQSFV